MLAWDDLRFVLAVARSGNLRAAAAALGVNHSTMFRRLNAAEAALGAKLFERLAAGYRPTEAGLRLIEAAERIEAETLALDRELTGRDTRLTGTLRVTASETLAFGMLTSEIARFRERHPGIVVEVLVDNRVLDLSRRETDIALRATRPSQGDLFGRKLADVRWCFYGAPGADGLLKTRRDLARHAIIRWAEATQPTKAAAWLAKHLPDAAFVSPNAPFAFDMAPYGRQWFTLQNLSNANALLGVKRAAPILNAYLDQELAKRNLDW